MVSSVSIYKATLCLSYFIIGIICVVIFKCQGLLPYFVVVGCLNVENGMMPFMDKA